MSIRLLAIFCSLLAACDPGPSPGSDGSIRRDAGPADGAGLLDAGAPREDAGVWVSDAGSLACSTAACDPRSPDGCEEGSCVLWGAQSSCEPAPGAFSPDTTCTTVMDCAPGLACFQTEEGGVCGRICCPGERTCTGDMVCGGSWVLVDGSETQWGRCLPPRSCDVLRPEETCAQREGCYIIDDAGTTQCRVAGSASAGDPCASQEDCQAGFFCGGIGSIRRCVRICRLGLDECPEGEGRCVAQAHSPDGSGFCTLDTTTAR